MVHAMARLPELKSTDVHISRATAPPAGGRTRRRRADRSWSAVREPRAWGRVG